jgi:hypothetical protein
VRARARVVTVVGAGIYEGNYVNGKKNGHGSFTWIDGSRYEVLLRVGELHRGEGGGGGGGDGVIGTGE